jgi:prepilin-type processing-associated H-X9-DG protein
LLSHRIPPRRGFTYIELLTIVVIVAILAALLFPVFVRARSVAQRTVCLSNMHVAAMAARLYAEDYSDLAMPLNYRQEGRAVAENDRTWVQLVMPYHGKFEAFFCPEDRSFRTTSQELQDEDRVNGDSLRRYYQAGKHVNLGYNHHYFSPVVRIDNRPLVQPRSFWAVEFESNTLLFADSRSFSSAYGGRGGSWLIVPPCRFRHESDGTATDTFAPLSGLPMQAVEVQVEGWSVRRSDPLEFGGVWPWHSGSANVVMLDGSVRSMTPQALGEGCDVKPQWQGLIRDPAAYVWDLH